jgi:hypothetical protein
MDDGHLGYIKKLIKKLCSSLFPSGKILSKREVKNEKTENEVILEGVHSQK